VQLYALARRSGEPFFTTAARSGSRIVRVSAPEILVGRCVRPCTELRYVGIHLFMWAEDLGSNSLLHSIQIHARTGRSSGCVLWFLVKRRCCPTYMASPQRSSGSHSSIRAGPEIVGVGRLNDSSYRRTHWKRWSSSPSSFSRGLCGERRPFISTPKTHDFRPGPNVKIKSGGLLGTGLWCPQSASITYGGCHYRV
jgi:hypothetical protein